MSQSEDMGPIFIRVIKYVTTVPGERELGSAIYCVPSLAWRMVPNTRQLSDSKQKWRGNYAM